MDAQTLDDITVSNSLFDGTPHKDIPNFYGDNDFLLIYDNRYSLRFRHFKTNWHHQHTYRIYVFEMADGIHAHISILGSDGIEFEHVLQPL
ncbi:hypothetical protein [Pseudomonas fluorescens]|uniref:Uncharacterized protein n=1 Tax=Pseudomonas fluorescens TaxID=294 RepID=A0A5E7P8G6_PSEFL|nr:hypothetical protein [Pseudomonas fluorescens]VVP43703.1 hypothetical protein PS880_04982 [Pseudomonas fluorescens]